MVLLSLGYSENEISSAMDRVLAKLSQTAPAEDILKESLRVLSVS
jgi:Holliday junction resolvasome RuvABC DNA-binding subunit